MNREGWGGGRVGGDGRERGKSSRGRSVDVGGGGGGGRSTVGGGGGG